MPENLIFVPMTALDLFFICLAVSLVGALLVRRTMISYVRLYHARFALWSILDQNPQREEDVYDALWRKGSRLSFRQFQKFMANLVNHGHIEEEFSPSPSFDPECERQKWYHTTKQQSTRSAAHLQTLYDS